MKTTIVCSPRSLPLEMLVAAARTAVEINPYNHQPVDHLVRLMPARQVTPERIAMLTKKYWGIQGVKLTASFLDNPPSNLRKRILLHMNARRDTAKVKFVETIIQGQVGIARVGGQDGGYCAASIHPKKRSASPKAKGATRSKR